LHYKSQDMISTQKRTQLILQVMNVLFWIVFIGLCIKTGALLISFSVSMFINPVAAKDLYMGLNLSALKQYDLYQYFFLAAAFIIITGLKAYIAYLVIKISLTLKINQPFSAEVSAFISKISRVALGTGVMAVFAAAWSKALVQKGIAMPITWNEGEILFFAGIVFIISLIFQRGIEIQTENELTV